MKKLIEDFALGNFLSDWNKEKDYEEITDTLSDTNFMPGDNKIVVWEPFENHPSENIASHIEDMNRGVKTLLKDILNTMIQGDITPEEAIKNIKE